jgi:hypothetical protein
MSRMTVCDGRSPLGNLRKCGCQAAGSCILLPKHVAVLAANPNHRIAHLDAIFFGVQYSALSWCLASPGDDSHSQNRQSNEALAANSRRVASVRSPGTNLGLLHRLPQSQSRPGAVPPARILTPFRGYACVVRSALSSPRPVPSLPDQSSPVQSTPTNPFQTRPDQDRPASSNAQPSRECASLAKSPALERIHGPIRCVVLVHR